MTTAGNIFFRRIGFEELAERSLQLPIVHLAIHRTFMGIATTLICTGIMMVVAFQSKGWFRVIFVVSTVVVFGCYFVFVAANNRFKLVILELCMAATFLYIFPNLRSKSKLRTVLWFFLIGAFVVYSLKVAENIREEIYINGCVDVRVLNPFETAATLQTKEPSGLCYEAFASVRVSAIEDGMSQAWQDRLNGLGLMADITLPALSQGWGWGHFWKDSILLYYYYFVDYQKYVAVKYELKTNSKVRIAAQYLGTQIKDSSSFVLTDAYANFSIVGFLLAAAIVGGLLGASQGLLKGADNLGLLVIAIFLAERVLYAEKELITLVLDCFKFSPLVLASAALLWGIPVRGSKWHAEQRIAAEEGSPSVHGQP